MTATARVESSGEKERIAAQEAAALAARVAEEKAKRAAADKERAAAAAAVLDIDGAHNRRGSRQTCASRPRPRAGWVNVIPNAVLGGAASAHRQTPVRCLQRRSRDSTEMLSSLVQAETAELP